MPYYSNRRTRGMKQTMFLLGVYLNNRVWEFRVKGTTNDYDLTINSQEIKCSCPDFQGRGRICKHLYFIIGRIAQNVSLIDTLESEIECGERGSKLTEEEFTNLTNTLTLRLVQRLSQQKPKQDNNDIDKDDDCTICFEPLNGCKLKRCCDESDNSCKNYFHMECILNWLSRDKSCPLCRRKWVNNISQDFDPLDQLSDFKLN
jgi:hypothetical protein